MSAEARSALRRLPPLGAPRSSARSRPTWPALTSRPPPADLPASRSPTALASAALALVTGPVVSPQHGPEPG
jgi:hypothetical protein